MTGENRKTKFKITTFHHLNNFCFNQSKFKIIIGEKGIKVYRALQISKALKKNQENSLSIKFPTA